jgi:Rrf2 family transcriptional regulator, iron-sulfur cluster assembly transcription factor
MFSKACEYGIRATLYIASESIDGRRSGLKSIAKESDSPEAYIAKILQILVKNEVIESLKGPNGGFEIEAKKLGKLCLSDIVRAIDGNSLYTDCGLGLKQCDADNPCPLHDQFKLVRDQLQNMLDNASLIDLAKGLQRGYGRINNQLTNSKPTIKTETQ